ncbi:MAG: amidohydrolase family protein, partial [Actinomycetota bacterium]|nr:amidohydrolase family protein [Actinomycetota bacterium]
MPEPLPSRGLAFRGTVWEGGGAEPYPGVVVVAGDGRIASIGADPELPEGLRVLGGDGCWVGPGVVDAHVHLAFGNAQAALRGGVVAVRDLGAPLDLALKWRTKGSPPAGAARVAVAGPVLTAPGGYPSRSWGEDGFAEFVATASDARRVVAGLASAGVDLVKVALEPAAGAPVPEPPVLRAVIDAAHEAGLPVTAHALTVAMVRRALDASVDELAHTPVERLPDDLVQRIARAGIAVVSTLQCMFSGGAGSAAAANAAALHRAGVVLRYGTDLGNTGTRPGADPRELDRLAQAGLGRLGALRAATEGSA